MTGMNTNRQDDAVRLLTDLLAIPSVNGKDREADAAEFLQRYFERNGIDSHVQEIDGKHANVTAFLPGRNPEETMIWNGHLDTVPYGDLHAWHTDPSVPVIRDGKLFGRGASDMKSGLAAMVFALCDLHSREKQPACNILFAGTCDEEKGGIGAEALLGLLGGTHTEPGKRPFLLVGEPTSLRPGTAQKGCLWLRLQIRGRTSHGAYPDRGVNAIDGGMRIAEAIRTFVHSYSHPVLGRATAQVTKMEGGVAPNMTPDRCSIVMDVRMVPPLKAEQVLEAGRRALEAEKQNLPGLDAQFECLNERRAIEIDCAHPQVLRLQELLRSAGRDDTPIGISFFTDASILDRDNGMDICLFGPGDPALAHQPDEFVEIDRYLEAIRILEELCQAETF